MENTYELFELDGTLYGTLNTWNPRLNPRPVVVSTPDTEGRVEVVQRVPQLVQARVRRVHERAIRPHGVLLVEGAHRRAAVEEPALVGVARRPVRAEDHRPRALEGQPLGQPRRVLPQPLALAGVDEAFEHEESIAPERRDFLRRQAGAPPRVAFRARAQNQPFLPTW